MRHDEPANLNHVLKPLVLLVALLAMLAMAEFASADTVRVHDAAGSGGPNITLGQIAELDGDYAKSLSDVVIAKFQDEAVAVKIEIAAIREAMREQSVAVGRLNLQGFAVCMVHRVGKPTEAADDGSERLGRGASPHRVNAEPVDNEPPAANVEGETITIDTPLTVERLIIESLRTSLNAKGDDLVIEFNERDAELLSQSAVAGRYTVEPIAEITLGSLTFEVRQFRGTEETHRERVSVRVRRRVLAVVAIGDIDRGSTIHRGLVEVREVLLDDRSGVPVRDRAVVLNQVASKRIPAGTMVLAQSIEAPMSVRRGEHIEITLHQGRLQITFNGIAKSDGALGDVIEVEHPRINGQRSKRESFIATVTGPRQVTVGDSATQSRSKIDE